MRRLRVEFWRWLDVLAERAMGLHHLDTSKMFGTVMQRIIESLERRPRGLVLIYTYPEQESVILETGRFVRTRTFRSPERTARRRVSVYVSEPSSLR